METKIRTETGRFLVAVVLSIAVIFGVQLLYPAKGGHGTAAPKGAAAARAPAHTAGTTPPTAVLPAASAAGSANRGSATMAAPQGGSAAAAIPAATPVVAPVRPETSIVATTRADSGATFRISNVGASILTAEMHSYMNAAHGGHVTLGVGGQPILRYALVMGGGAPVSLANIPFQETVQGAPGGSVLTYTAPAGAPPVTLQYRVAPDSFVAHVTGQVANAPANSYLVVELPNTMPVTEADTADDQGSLAYAYMSVADGARNVLFHSLDPGERKVVQGPVTWVAAKSKYFVVGVLAPKGGTQFTEADLVGGPRTSKVATMAAGSVVVPLHNGAFAFDAYMGPQEWRRLNAMGRSFDEVNPYGWAFLRGALQPIAAGVIQLVLWMHSKLHLSYGWVLILLGVLVRLVMWPLYQSSMRTSLKMQVMQPELQAVQDRYKEEPEKQRTEIMKVYQQHGMSPLSPVMGCLPSLLPMPVLFALFFVFRSTIEFRGVPFLWLPDLSVKDPYYLLPLIMGLSMYLVSWIGMRGLPPNPQAKMMSYMMPVVFTFFFFRAASGLNLYYATQNLAALPQQWQLTRERVKVAARTGGAGKPAGPSPGATPKAGGKGRNTPVSKKG